MWTTFILLANICSQIHKQDQIREEIVTSIVLWVLMGLAMIFLILSFILNKHNVKYALIIMQVSLITSLFLHDLEDDSEKFLLKGEFVKICILVYLNI